MFPKTKSTDLFFVAARRVTAYPLKDIQSELRRRGKHADVRLLNRNDGPFEPNLSAWHFGLHLLDSAVLIGAGAASLFQPERCRFHWTFRSTVVTRPTRKGNTTPTRKYKEGKCSEKNRPTGGISCPGKVAWTTVCLPTEKRRAIRFLSTALNFGDPGRE